LCPKGDCHVNSVATILQANEVWQVGSGCPPQGQCPPDTNGNLATATALTAGVTVGSVNTSNNTVSVMLPFPAGVNAGSLTATATVLSVGNGQTASVGDTSEFSAGATVAAPAQPG
jgi:hypothetical protein